MWERTDFIIIPTDKMQFHSIFICERFLASFALEGVFFLFSGLGLDEFLDVPVRQLILIRSFYFIITLIKENAECRRKRNESIIVSIHSNVFF